MFKPTSALTSAQITQLIQMWNDGDVGAGHELAAWATKELHPRARRLMRGERIEHTLQATALINEVYLKMLEGNDWQWVNRIQLRAAFAVRMRHVLIDHARRHNAEKRYVENTQAHDVASPDDRNPNLIALDHVLTELNNMDARRAQVVELRFRRFHRRGDRRKTWSFPRHR